VPTANEAHDTLQYWSPVIGFCSLLFLSITLPALKWLWDLKTNHVHTIEENSEKTLAKLDKVNETLIAIKTILEERRD
jgi:hypothetical protein